MPAGSERNEIAKVYHLGRELRQSPQFIGRDGTNLPTCPSARNLDAKVATLIHVKN
jgi:hypothetical protein